MPGSKPELCKALGCLGDRALWNDALGGLEHELGLLKLVHNWRLVLRSKLLRGKKLLATEMAISELVVLVTFN